MKPKDIRIQKFYFIEIIIDYCYFLKIIDMASNENIYFHQLTKLPQQITRCPKAIRHIYPGTNQFNRKSGLTTDDYLRAGWEPSHNMMNVVLRVKQVEFKIVALLDGKRIEVTNLMCTNDSVFNVQITAWGLYARNLSNLQENTVKITD